MSVKIAMEEFHKVVPDYTPRAGAIAVDAVPTFRSRWCWNWAGRLNQMPAWMRAVPDRRTIRKRPAR